MPEYKEEDLKRIWKTETEIYQAIAKICEDHGLRYYAAYGTVIGALRHKGFIPWDDDMDVCMPRRDYEAFLGYAEKELPEKMGIYGIGYTKGFVMPMVKIVNKRTVFVEESDQDKKYVCGIYVDVFPMDAAPPTEELKRKHRKRIMRLGRAMVLAEYPHGKLPEGMNPVVKAGVSAGCAVIHAGLKVFGFTVEKLNKAFEKEARRYETDHVEEYELTAYFSEWETEYTKAEVIFPTKEMAFEDITIKVPKEADQYIRDMYGDWTVIPPPEKRHNHCPVKLKFE